MTKSPRPAATPSQQGSVASHPPRWRAIDVILAAVIFGLLAGLVEVVAAIIRHRVMHTTLYVGPEMLWQYPLADAIVFAALTLPLAGLGAAWGRLRAPPVVLAILAGLLVFSALLLTEKIHVVAEAVLAAGLGVGIARLLALRSEKLRRVFRVGAPLGLVLLGVVAVGQARLMAAAERGELGRIAGAPASRPNILLLVLDTVRAWDLSLYGYGRPTTPRLQQWATRGTLFERALAPAPWTTLSHAVMFTGHYPTELSVSWRTPYDGEFPTLAEALRDAGYATGGFVGNYLNTGRGTGLGQGFLHYEDYPLQLIPLLRSTTLVGRLLRIERVREVIGWRRTVSSVVAPDVNRRFLRWLDQRGPRPWFAFLNYFDAHGPYLPPESFEKMYMGKVDPPVDRFWSNVVRAYGRPPLPAQLLGEQLDAYDGAITYLDVQVDSLLKALEGRGLLQNTIVIITSDHGEMFGEHGIVGHGNNLFLPVLHVPLLVVAPGRAPANTRIQRLVSLRDLPATLMELSGVAGPAFPGHSLVSQWSAAAGAQTPDTLLASVDYNWLIPAFPPSPVLRGPMRTVVLDSLQYILNGDGAEELYHLGRDSWEIHNLVALPEYQADLARHRLALATLLVTARAPSPTR